ncbi:lanthionine synthetase LanC family protein [Hyalangium versicolor]|uniref:lanthionine synthetase LanC family protein n=1 Tax=Hyalangium versicolor TaxID=2861190 RepID=UPI001CCF6764|nr:lanthionine synthetase LanC family protein [Hyalangium versicolor]
MSGSESLLAVAKRILDSPREAPASWGGLAYGLEGWAWVLGGLSRAGLFHPAPAVIDWLYERMCSAPPPGELPHAAALEGPFGQLVSLAALAKLAPRFRALLHQRLRLLEDVAPPQLPDLSKGALGGISALLSLTGTYRLRVSPKVFDAWAGYGVEVAEALLDTSPKEGMFLGLLHGLAGAVAVVERLHRRRRLRFIRAFRRHAVSILMQSTRPTEGSAKAWPLMTHNPELTFFATCSGVPGITAGLCAARLWSGWAGYDAPIALGLEMLGDPRVRRSYLPAHSLCCGQTGEAHALAWMGHLTGNPRLLRRARRVHAEVSLADVKSEARTRKRERTLFVDELGWLYTGLHLRHPGRLPYAALC